MSTNVNHSLGIRLNNPMCIRYSRANNWRGQIGQSNGFCRFNSLADGVRAGVFIILRYVYTYHLYDVSDIISRFAPDSDGNDVESYKDFVIQYIRDRDKELCGTKLLDDDYWFCYRFINLIVAMCLVESGIYTRNYLMNFGVESMISVAMDEYMKNVLYPVYSTLSWIRCRFESDKTLHPDNKM